MHVNVVMGGQLDEHLLFWQSTVHLYNSVCYYTVPIVCVLRLDHCLAGVWFQSHTLAQPYIVAKLTMLGPAHGVIMDHHLTMLIHATYS